MGILEDIINEITSINYRNVLSKLSSFVQETVEKAGARGVVVGVSGGVDSAATLALVVHALGSSRVKALVMPDTDITPKTDIEDALELVRKYNVEHYYVDIKNIVNTYRENLPIRLDKVVEGNIRARIRMTILYAYANQYNLLVAGTGDRSEILIGYFTKYGDGGADFFPIGCLYKTQVRKFATFLGVPEKIAYKPSSPRLWKDHLAEKELGLKYEVIDAVLYTVFDKKLSPQQTAQRLGIPIEIVNSILSRHSSTKHKREIPPIPDPQKYVWS